MNTSLLEGFTDEQLVLAFQSSGDNRYIKGIYDRHHRKIFFTCLGIVKDREIASDLTQDIVLKMIQFLPQLKNGQLLGFWLHRIAKNHCIDYQKSCSPSFIIGMDDDLDIEDNQSDMDLLLFREALFEKLDTIVDSLSAEDRTLVKLKYYNHYSIQSLEEYFGLSKSAIKMRLARARNRIRKLYLEQLERVNFA